MKILSYDELKPVKGIPYSKCQIWRLEKTGQFPQTNTSRRRHVTAGPSTKSTIGLTSAMRERGSAPQAA